MNVIEFPTPSGDSPVSELSNSPRDSEIPVLLPFAINSYDSFLLDIIVELAYIKDHTGHPRSAALYNVERAFLLMKKGFNDQTAEILKQYLPVFHK